MQFSAVIQLERPAGTLESGVVKRARDRELEQRHDAGMHQLGHEGDFALEAFRADRVRQRRRQHLDRHESIEVAIVGAIHDRHPAASDLLVDLEPFGELNLVCRNHRYRYTHASLPESSLAAMR